MLENSQENTCARASFLKSWRPEFMRPDFFIKKEILTQVFSCEFCEIFKIAFFTEQLWTTSSVEQ